MSARPLSRRTFLRGAAGATLALPWLEATHARAQTGAPMPRRLLVIAHHQGTQLDRWRPAGTGADFPLSPLLSPFEPIRDRMTVLSGIDNLVRQEMSGDGHMPAARSMATAHAFSQSLDEAGRLVPGGRSVQNGPAGGPSFESVVARRQAGDAPHPRLDFRVGRPVSSYQVFWADRELPVTALGDPREIADSLFGSIEAPPQPSRQDRLRGHRRKVLDAVLDNHRSFRARLGSEDRARLDAYADRVETLERSLADAAAPRDCAPLDLSFLPPGYRADRQDMDEQSAFAVNRAIALAFGCDLTRVATLQFTDFHAPLFQWLGQDIPGRFNDWHAMVHEGSDPYHQDLLYAGFEWYSRMVADLLNALAAFPEGDGTVLDHTLVVWLSEFGDGSVHSTREIPVVLFGDAGGQIRTGRHLDFSGHTTGDLFATVLNLFGGTESSFGLERGWDGNPLGRGLLTGLG